MKIFVGLLAVGVAFGLFATKSALYAGETGQVKTVELQEQVDKVSVPMQKMRTALYKILADDEQYVAAEAVLEAYDGNDELEYIRLDGDRVQIARAIYEENFGPWQGNARELVALLATDPQPVRIRVCVKGAVDACGKGKVKSVTITAEGGCSFTCGTPTQ